MFPQQILVHSPTLLSSLRLLLAATLVGLAVRGLGEPFLFCFLAALATDALDGFLARRFDLQSRFGALMDSWADALAWIAFTVGAFLLWPEVFHREAGWIAAALAAFLLPGLLGLIRYRRLPGLHTWGAKLSMALMGVSVLLLFGGLAAIPFKLSVAVLVLAGIEQCLVILRLPKPRDDVRSLAAALRLRKSEAETKD